MNPREDVKLWALLVLACCVPGQVCSAQTLAVPVSPGARAVRAGPQIVTYFSVVDGTDQPYAVYVPRDYDVRKRYPLVVALHGAGSNHRENLRRVFGKGNRENIPEDRYWPEFPDVEYLVACPLSRGTLGFQGPAERDVYDVLADVKKRFSVDEDRVYLTGLSMGGGGALWLALTRPDVWAAVAVLCPSLADGVEAWVPNALGVPVRLFHGTLDPVVPVAVSRNWDALLKKNGARVEYTEFPRVRHNVWDFAYRNAAIFDWFSQFRREWNPERVRFVTDRYAYRSSHWVSVDALTPGTFAEVDARFVAANQIEVKTRGLTGFTLNVAGHPQFDAKKPLKVSVDGTAIAVRAGAALSFSKSDRWVNRAAVIGAGFKRPGSEGPVLAAFAAPHIYVYGTADKPSAAVIEERKQLATHAADWSTVLFALLYSPKIVADTEVTEDEIAGSNLILFGTRETNALVARFDAVLPFELNAGAADYGVLAIAPKPGGYVVLSSGLPWWTGFEFKREGLSYLSPRYRLLTSFEDYLVFRGALENVVASGWFQPDWRVPAETRAVLEKTGAIRFPAPPQPSISKRP